MQGRRQTACSSVKNIFALIVHKPYTVPRSKLAGQTSVRARLSGPAEQATAVISGTLDRLDDQLRTLDFRQHWSRSAFGKAFNLPWIALLAV